MRAGGTGWNIVNLLKTKDNEKKLKKSGGKKTHWIQMNNHVNDSWGLSKNDVRQHMNDIFKY